MSRDTLKCMLVLGRVSNLPTVWSNCLAAWMLASMPGPDRCLWPVLPTIAAGCSLLYLGGMFLNDACDVSFDAAHRPERPIPSGKISRRSVTVLGCLWIVAGGLLLTPFTLTWTIALAGLILFYDVAHKHNPIAPLVMSGCRALIYPLAGTACLIGKTSILPSSIWTAALGMAAWVLAISLLAKRESIPATTLEDGIRSAKRQGSVSNLLAAIPLVDLLVVSPQSISGTLPFIIFACLALLLRNKIPST